MNEAITIENGSDHSELIAADLQFIDCTAEGVTFDDSQLTRVSFVRCDLYWASFFRAKLVNVNFEFCDLRGADFKRTQLRNCRFIGCDLGTDAIGGRTYFDDAELTDVEFVDCRGP